MNKQEFLSKWNLKSIYDLTGKEVFIDTYGLKAEGSDLLRVCDYVYIDKAMSGKKKIDRVSNLSTNTEIHLTSGVAQGWITYDRVIVKSDQQLWLKKYGLEKVEDLVGKVVRITDTGLLKESFSYTHPDNKKFESVFSACHFGVGCIGVKTVREVADITGFKVHLKFEGVGSEVQGHITYNNIEVLQREWVTDTELCELGFHSQDADGIYREFAGFPSAGAQVYMVVDNGNVMLTANKNYADHLATRNGYSVVPMTVDNGHWRNVGQKRTQMTWESQFGKKTFIKDQCTASLEEALRCKQDLTKAQKAAIKEELECRK